VSVRTSMADLIIRVRELVGDPVIAGTPSTSTYTDQQLQDALDAHRTEVRNAPLRPLQTITAGIVTYHDWFAPRGAWEASPVLTDGAYAVLTPSASDLIAGKWTFTATQGAVLVTGACFDLYGAAVDVLLMTLQSKSAEFDFSADGQSFSRSQQAAGIRALIEAYRTKVRAPAIRVIQNAADTW
jgi:hypothetical protein